MNTAQCIGKIASVMGAFRWVIDILLLSLMYYV